MTRPMARLKKRGGGGASIIVSAGRGIQHNYGKNEKLLVSADSFGECLPLLSLCTHRAGKSRSQ